MQGLLSALLIITIIFAYDFSTGKNRFYSLKGLSFKQLKTDLIYTILVQIGLYPYIAFLVSLGIPFVLGKLLRSFLNISLSKFSDLLPKFVINILEINLDSPFVSKLIASICFIVFLDFLNYCLHLITHKNEYLWQIHKIHHSAEVFNIFVNNREHPLYQAISFIPSSICIAIFGNPTSLISNFYWLFLMVIYNSIGYLKHSNINSSWGWFGKYIIQSPMHHRAHHVDVDSYYDSNFSNVLQVWDHLFKTYKEPHKEDINLRSKLGISSDIYPYEIDGNASFLKTIIFPFKSCYKIFRNKSFHHNSF